MSRPLVGHVNTIITLMTRSAFLRLALKRASSVRVPHKTGAKARLGVYVGIHLSLVMAANGSDPTADALKTISVPVGDHSQSTAH
jgi:hypothetical protein